MTKSECIKTLTDFNAWRRGGEWEKGDENMPNPKLIGEAIDCAIHLLKEK